MLSSKKKMVAILWETKACNKNAPKFDQWNSKSKHKMVKLVILELFYKSNAMSINIPMGHFYKSKKIILKFMWISNRLKYPI